MPLLTTPALTGDIDLSVAASLKEVINELSDSFANSIPSQLINF